MTAGMKTRAKILWALLLLAVSGGCAAMVGGDRPVPSATVVPLDRERPGIAIAGALAFRGALELEGGGKIGGLSGLWVAPDGGRFVAIGDTGLVVTGRLTYDPAGRLSGALELRARPLAVEEGVTAKKRRSDAEELIRLPDGGWVVALERDHRLLHYRGGEAGPEGTPARVPVPPTVEEDSPANGGLESLARLADGRLLTIEEGEEDGVRERRAWVTRSPAARAQDAAVAQTQDAEVPRRREDWLPLTYRAAPRYRPAGAAPLPDGGALVLERRVSLIGGWSSRIVRVPASALRAGALVDGEDLARLEPPLLNDNFEGIATRPGANGETLVYLVSDDNFSPLQRSYLVLFALPASP